MVEFFTADRDEVPFCHKNRSKGKGSELGPYVAVMELSRERKALLGSSNISLKLASGILTGIGILFNRCDKASKTWIVQTGYRKAGVRNFPEIHVKPSSERQNTGVCRPSIYWACKTAEPVLMTV